MAVPNIDLPGISHVMHAWTIDQLIVILFAPLLLIFTDITYSVSAIMQQKKKVLISELKCLKSNLLQFQMVNSQLSIVNLFETHPIQYWYRMDDPFDDKWSDNAICTLLKRQDNMRLQHTNYCSTIYNCTHNIYGITRWRN